MCWSKVKLVLFTLYLFFLPIGTSLFSQMPGWVTYLDKDGNLYYMDKNGRIYTEGDPTFNYKPISINGIDYYLEHAKSLYKRSHKAEALYIFKALRFLGDLEPSVSRVASSAQIEIHRIKKREGGRFGQLDQKSSLVLVKSGQLTYVYNSKLNYYIKLEGEITILKRKIKQYQNHLSYGIMIGVKSDKNQKGEDYIITIYGEKFPYRLLTVRNFEKVYTNRAIKDNFNRSLIKSSKKERLYSFNSVNGGYSLSGFETLKVINQYGFFIRIFTSSENSEKLKEFQKRVNENIIFSN